MFTCYKLVTKTDIPGVWHSLIVPTNSKWLVRYRMGETAYPLFGSKLFVFSTLADAVSCSASDDCEVVILRGHSSRPVIGGPRRVSICTGTWDKFWEFYGLLGGVTVWTPRYTHLAVDFTPTEVIKR